MDSDLFMQYLGLFFIVVDGVCRDKGDVVWCTGSTSSEVGRALCLPVFFAIERRRSAFKERFVACGIYDVVLWLG